MAVLTSVKRADVRRDRVPQATRTSMFEASRRRMFGPFVAPALIVYVAVMVLPTFFSVWLSFNKWAGAGPFDWVGLRNYSVMLKDPIFRTAFVNTFWIVVGVGVAVFAISFALMMVLQDCWGRKAVRLIIFFPSLVPAIVISILWGFLFNSDGLINTMLGKAGMRNPPDWLSQENVLWVILLGMIWMAAGTYTVIFMAAADRIPPEFYEAAAIDGANPWQRFRNVTLPMMWDVVSVCAVLWCISALKTFEFLLTFSAASSSMPPTSIWNFAMYSYAQAFQPTAVAQYGSAAASGVITMILTLVLVVLARRVTRRNRLTY